MLLDAAWIHVFEGIGVLSKRVNFQSIGEIGWKPHQCLLSGDLREVRSS